MHSEQGDAGRDAGLVALWVGMVGVLVAGYALAILAILGSFGQGIIAVGIGFAVARVLARPISRRRPHQARRRAQRRRSVWVYWLCALGGFALFVVSSFVSPSLGPFGLPMIIAGAAAGLMLNTIALVTAFRAGIHDFANSQRQI